ncbi:hypothetical protein [Chryseobacterium oryctis]|uniref:Carboxypeptidase regulatory-like domain-containing protein n=1 Tax=Chryseobacterium oryctis TaxID=2952618 RepID=A0ABT3HPN7_9FLAO|nr:hypothetical protein [Chryseobacterium oryctis]MCW3161714.1 hypothetical protein [Chryseobacterium oryctis]
MKNRVIKVIFTILGILILLLFIRPQKVIYLPKISGKVIDENGIPIKDAYVSRIEEKNWKNEKWGYEESSEYEFQTVLTDKNGYFFLDQKSRIDWFHTPFDLPIAWCFAEFKVSKAGYENYKTEFDDYKSFRKEGCYACEEIEFKPTIKLKKNSR